MGCYTGGHNVDKRTTMKNQNRSAALGRPAMKLLGGFNEFAVKSSVTCDIFFPTLVTASLSGEQPL